MSTITKFNGNASALRASVERELADLDQRIESDRREVRMMLDNAEAQGRNALSPAEDIRAESLLRSVESARAARARKASALAEARAIEAEENESENRLSVTHRTAVPRSNRTASLSVTRNDRTYNQSTDPTGRNFLLDVARGAVFNDRDANARLDRHTQEERVERPQYVERAAGDLITSGLGGLVVPQYLVDLYAPAVANMRPFADLCNHHELPDSGMSLTIPLITTPASAALQATQLTAVSSTTLVETDLTLTVQTAAGSQNVSRQAVERGTGVDQVTTADLFKRVATVLDNTLLNQASTGVTNTAQTVTYTDASPTPALFYPNIFMAESKLEQTLLAQARVDTVVMHNRRWNWLCAGVGSTWPFLQNVDFPGTAQNNAIQVSNAYGSSYRGILSNGLKVCVDANVLTNGGVGTNQDEVYVLSSEESHLWEAPSQPMLIRVEQTNAANLGILLVVYEYFAFTHKRYSSNPAKISGTGLVGPAGF
jgi:hypothetical protein